MKKIYMKPNTEIVKLQLERVIATSTLNINTEVKAQSIGDDYGFTMNDKEDFDATDELW